MNTKKITRIIICMALVLMLAFTTSCGAQATIPKDYQYDDLSEYIDLADYKGLEYSKITGDVTDEEVKSYIDSKLASSDETEQIKEGTVEKDSIVNIDFVGSIDGVEFDGGAASGVDLDIANSGYIKGFAEGIVGHKVGETFDLHVTFPENYGKEELNGKPAVFKTTINYLIKKKKATFNDEWVAKNSEYKTTAEYEKSVKDKLSQEKLSTADSDEKREVFNKISGASEVKSYPEKELEARTAQVRNMYSSYAESSNMKLKDFLSSQMGIDEEQFKTMTEDSAKQSIKQELILYAIQRAEGIEAGQEGYNKFLEKTLKEAGLTEDTFKQQSDKSFTDYADENNMYTAYLYEVVMDKIMEYSVAK